MTEKPRLPVVGEFVRSVGRLVGIQTIDPPPQPPPQKDYIFEDVSARCEMRLNGERINLINTLNDFFGVDSGIKSAINEMVEYCEDKKIGPESDIEVVVVKVVCRYRARPCADVLKIFNNKNYRNFNFLKAGACWDLPEDVETIVWSSKDKTPDQPEK